MNNNFTLFILICLSIASCGSSKAFTMEAALFTHISDEYEQLKSEGDTFFEQGEYKKAKFKYLACLEVPGYSTDNYATNRATTCERALDLIQKAKTALNKNDSKEAVSAYEELSLYINPDDQKIKKELANLYTRLGDTAMQSNEKSIAKEYYQKSIRYFHTKQTAEKLKANDRQVTDNRVVKKPILPEENKKPLPSSTTVQKTTTPQKDQTTSIPKGNSGKKIAPIIVSSSVGIITFIVAQNLNKNWNTHLADLSTSYSSGNSIEYKAQYDKTSSYHKKLGLRNALMVTSGLALVADVFFLSKIKKQALGSVSLKPTGAGLSATITMK